MSILYFVAPTILLETIFVYTCFKYKCDPITIKKLHLVKLFICDHAVLFDLLSGIWLNIPGITSA